MRIYRDAELAVQSPHRRWPRVAALVISCSCAAGFLSPSQLLGDATNVAGPSVPLVALDANAWAPLGMATSVELPSL